LPPAVLRRQTAPRPSGAGDTGDSRNLVEKTEQYERSIIMAELAKYDWNKTKAASALGITRRILSYKMQNLGIDKPTPIIYDS
jgi:two-component system, NtrC family, response regulator HupR/HoxA